MKLRLPGDLLRRSLLRPEPILAFLIAVAALVYFLDSRTRQQPTLVEVDISQGREVEAEPTEVRLVLFDQQGLEAPTFATLELPVAADARIAAILDALREEMLGEGWPSELPVPTVFIDSSSRSTIAVLDFRPEEPLSLGIAQEQMLLRSIQETVLSNGVNGLRFLLQGEASGVFLEHLEVPAAL